MTNKELQLERLNALLKLIIEKDENNQFNMEVWGESNDVCGTVCCIAGWTVHGLMKEPLVYKDVLALVDNEVEYLYPAANYLGLSYDLARALFILNKFNFGDLSISWIYTDFRVKNIEDENKEGLSRLKQLISHIESSDEESLVKSGICDYTNINVTDYA